MERLQKFLARAGVASRRRAEELIEQGRIKVNGVTVQEMGTKIEPEKDTVALDNQVIKLTEDKVYLLLNKPDGVVTTLFDPQKRKKISDLLSGVKERVYPVGRLDYHTEGLLLLTNDGELAYRLTHPKYKVDKTYLAKVSGPVNEGNIAKLRKGVILEDGITAPAGVKRLEKTSDSTLLEVTIHEGRNRQVRRMCEAIGHRVLTLQRISFGPLQLKDLPVGKFRYLSQEELKLLKKACGLLPKET